VSARTAVTTDPVATYALRQADDCLVLSHRLAQWSSRAPTLEEDVALTNIALDILGQGRVLYARTAELDGSGRAEDDYAYLRDERDFVNCLLVEQENGDFAVTVMRQLLFSTYQLEVWKALTASADPQLAAIAAKAVKEVTYHLDHATQWALRLGDGTDESHRRAQLALERLWPFASELFEADWVIDDLVARGVAADPRRIQPVWDALIDGVLREATLERPSTSWAPTGGRRGLHTEAFGYMLAEMQHLARAHPGARW
jgi:ring-1,2-phenylacetyl-CoA epoxidase subunit PaaC